MAYKDKDKQKEADRERQQRRCDKIKVKGVIKQGVTTEGVTQGVTGTPDIRDETNTMLVNYGQPDCECKHCQQSRTNKSKNIINHGTYKTASQLARNEVNRISLPGDVDYAGVCTVTGGNMSKETHTEKLKRMLKARGYPRLKLRPAMFGERWVYEQDYPIKAHSMPSQPTQQPTGATI